uniref:C-type lectin domain-containing protein n=1 Tax=Fundulus heteroclitus TaxID=8078 RepID=A0A3Q2PLP1_FUNHE
NPTRTSKLPSEKVVLLVLGSLLAAALIVIYRLCELLLMFYFYWFYQTRQIKEGEVLNEHDHIYLHLLTAVFLICFSSNQLLIRYKQINFCSDLFKDKMCLKCEAGWELHGGNCYNFSTKNSSWTESRRSCKDLGGDLVKIDSREKGLMEEAEDKFWIGLTDSKEEGRWLWVDGSPLNESLKFWCGDEPDDWKDENPAGEDCGRMGMKGGASDLKCWFDKSCDVPHKSICEKSAVSGQTAYVCV